MRKKLKSSVPDQLLASDVFFYRKDDAKKMDEFNIPGVSELFTAAKCASLEDFSNLVNDVLDSHSLPQHRLRFYQLFLRHFGLKPQKTEVQCRADLMDVLTAERRWLLRCQTELASESPNRCASGTLELCKENSQLTEDNDCSCAYNGSQDRPGFFTRFNPERGFLPRERKGSTKKDCSQDKEHGERDEANVVNEEEGRRNGVGTTSLMDRLRRRMESSMINETVDDDHIESIDHSEEEKEVSDDPSNSSSQPIPSASPTIRFCRQCHFQCPKPTRSFCSSGCLHLYKIRSSGSYVRSSLLIRDRGVCQMCHLDCEKLRSVINAYLKSCHGITAAELALQLGPPCPQALRVNRRGIIPRGNFWHSDHILAVCEGGGNSGLENYRTLCIQCHHEVTAELRRNRAKSKPLRRRKAAGQKDGEEGAAAGPEEEGAAAGANVSPQDGGGEPQAEELTARAIEQTTATKQTWAMTNDEMGLSLRERVQRRRDLIDDGRVEPQIEKKTECAKRHKVGRWYRKGLGR